jgi:hypothetical protein
MPWAKEAVVEDRMMSLVYRWIGTAAFLSPTPIQIPGTCWSNPAEHAAEAAEGAY